MGVTHRKAIGTTAFGLAVVLLSCYLAVGAEEGQAAQKKSDQLLLDIMDMHTGLVTNQVFIAQAGVIAAYLETARGSDDAMKVEIYTRVQKLLSKIQPGAASGPEKTEASKQDADQALPPKRSPDAAVKYTRGIALLEVFKGKSMNHVPEVPVIRTYWKQGLTCKGFPVPGREGEIGWSTYVAKFTFWYEAPQSGQYSFSLRGDESLLRIGGVDVVKSSGDVEQGVCSLEKGFHRAEFWYVNAPNGYQEFEAKVLPPGDFDTIPFSQNMLLLPADQVKGPQEGQPRKVGGQAIPYVDY